MNSKIAKKIKRGVMRFGQNYTGGIIEKQPPEHREELRRYMERCLAEINVGRSLCSKTSDCDSEKVDASSTDQPTFMGHRVLTMEELKRDLPYPPEPDLTERYD
jgi:hypothetical protein